jgi:hypothetical protein
MSRIAPTSPTVKRLFALSGNICAFPNCNEHLVDAKGNVLAEMCHIEAAEKGGERYNHDSNDEFRRSFENLILLCRKHHVITNDVIEYTSIILKDIKFKHESKFLNEKYNASDEVVDKTIEKYMEQNNQNSGDGTQINSQAQNINTIIGTQINNFDSKTMSNQKNENSRKINNESKNLIEDEKKSADSTDVIDFRNEIAEKFRREIFYVPINHLKFRKENGRIKADVETYQRNHDIILNESDTHTQKLLKEFLLKNDSEKNKELRNLLKNDGQRQPAIITCDGFLINGNRRKLALEMLYEENHQDPNFATMKVIILPDYATEIDLIKIESCLQLQSEGKSEYHGLNKALTYRSNIKKGMTLEAQLKLDGRIDWTDKKEFEKEIKKVTKEFLKPLEYADKYLKFFNKEGHYNTISESAGDKEGRWQAFLDYSEFAENVLLNDSERHKIGVVEGDITKIHSAIFKIIRKREINSQLESTIGKLHAFVRGSNLKKYLSNQEAKKFLFKIAEDVPKDISDPEKLENGERLSERKIDEIWGQKASKPLFSSLVAAYRAVHIQQERDKPLDILEDAFKKLIHDNLKIEHIGNQHLNKALELVNKIMNRADLLHSQIDHARQNLKDLSNKK